MYALIRCPTAMEDEGHYHLFEVYSTLDELKAALNENLKRSKGYWIPAHFCYATLESCNELV